MREQRYDRKIFRGQCVGNGEWVVGYYVAQYGAHEIYLLMGADKEHEFDRYYVVPETVGQYIGRDKNGKKIFEHDIVGNGAHKYLVAWDGQQLEFAFFNIVGAKQGRCNCDTLSICEGIGNVFDNPGLLDA